MLIGNWFLSGIVFISTSSTPVSDPADIVLRALPADNLLFWDVDFGNWVQDVASFCSSGCGNLLLVKSFYGI